MSKKVIITGVNGQTGSYMAEFLIQHTSNEVYGTVRRTANPNLENIQGLLKNPRFHVVHADLTDSQSIDELVSSIKPDYFINLAAQSFVGISWKMPEMTMDVDAIGVLRCMETIRRHAPLCRFYNAGSSEEFGDVQFSPQNEDHPLRARSPYGAAKIAARQLVKVYRESYNLYAVQGILFNHESPRRGPEFVSRKITLGIARIKKALERGRDFEPIRLGNLDSSRDWSHAKDFVLGVWLMLNQDETSFWQVKHNKDDSVQKRHEKIVKNLREYVLASGETHTIREFITLALEAAGIKYIDANPQRLAPFTDKNAEQINYSLEDGTPLIVSVAEFFRPAEVDMLLGDATRARTILSWTALHSFKMLVEEMVQRDLKDLD